MRHEDSHDPIAEWSRCWICNQALSAAFARVADLHLGLAEAGELLERIRAEAALAIAQTAAP
jgi:hypothetical protein